MNTANWELWAAIVGQRICFIQRFVDKTHTERTARVSILFQSGNTVKLSVNEIKVRTESECATPVYRGITWRCLLIRLLSGIIVWLVWIAWALDGWLIQILGIIQHHHQLILFTYHTHMYTTIYVYTYM